MTHDAILKASDDQLKNDLGLTKLGDILSVRAFSENHSSNKRVGSRVDSDARKKRLIEELAKKRSMKQQGVHAAKKGRKV